MIPVIQKDVSKIDIIVSGRWAIDLDSAKHSVPSLSVEVGMVPTSSKLNCTPAVGKGVVGRDGALGDTGYTIHGICPVLTNTMEMQTSAVGLWGVLDTHNFDSPSVPARRV